MSKPIKYGIIGAGHLGNYHAQQLKKISCVKLIGVFDLDLKKSSLFSKSYKIKYFKSLGNLLNECDAVSITSPATAHHKNAIEGLNSRCHLFIEKPFTKNITEARAIISLEKKLDLKIQVGHIERFNAAFTGYMQHKKNPVFIESHRLCAYNERGLDVDVILDLMIHDIDLILTINPYKIKSIHASGSKILTESLDMVNARIEFINNVTANLTASRISLKQMRQMRIFEKASYHVLDFQTQSLNSWCVNNSSLQEKKITTVPTNALFDELLMFVDCINNNSKTKVGTKEGFQALKIASSIQKTIEKKQ